VAPWIDYLDLGEVARVLRRARAGSAAAQPLCPVPAPLAGVVDSLCGQARSSEFFAWNCSHLPCSVLAPKAHSVDCVQARVFRYRCRQHVSLAALVAAREPLHVLFDGRLRVNETSFVEQVPGRRVRPPGVVAA
jgi:hypothetical protein